MEKVCIDRKLVDEMLFLLTDNVDNLKEIQREPALTLIHDVKNKLISTEIDIMPFDQEPDCI